MNRILEALVREAETQGAAVYQIAVADECQSVEEAVLTPANPCQNSYSVAKAFAATAVGILADRGQLSLEDRVTALLSDFLIPGMDEKWDSMTVRNLLTHRCGFPGGYLDIDVDDRNAYGTDDFLQYLFRTPLLDPPGTEYRYSDAAYYLVSRVVTRVTGEKLDDFLWRELFAPLGVREAAWSRCPMGYPMGATGLYIRTADVARLASVYACGGRFRERAILSEKWIAEATDGRCAFTPHGDSGLWQKGGMRGQMAVFSKEKHIAAAWHGFQADSKPLIDRFAAILSETNR